MLSQLFLGLVVAGTALATPLAEPALVDHLGPHLFVRQTAGTCRNQSCLVATVSGSTGMTVYPYKEYPTGDTQDGDCCIVRYFPAAKAAIYLNRPGLQSYCASHGGDAPKDSNPPGVSSVSVEYPPTATATTTTNGGLFGLFPRQTAACKPNIMIYVKGTFEIGDYGQTLGPMFQQNIDTSKWSIVGVEYDNSLDNDYCLGLPGGPNLRNVLSQQLAACPNANIALVGYSQGAMVVRHAIARAPASQVARIKSVLTYGDPFCGAEIGQYNGPIHVFCIDGDGVCNGQLDITLQHLSYGGDVSQGLSLVYADVGN